MGKNLRERRATDESQLDERDLLGRQSYATEHRVDAILHLVEIGKLSRFAVRHCMIAHRIIARCSALLSSAEN